VRRPRTGLPEKTGRGPDLPAHPAEHLLGSAGAAAVLLTEEEIFTDEALAHRFLHDFVHLIEADAQSHNTTGSPRGGTLLPVIGLDLRGQEAGGGWPQLAAAHSQYWCEGRTVL
jgi:hypothetical protein